MDNEDEVRDKFLEIMKAVKVIQERITKDDCVTIWKDEAQISEAGMVSTNYELGDVAFFEKQLPKKGE